MENYKRENLEKEISQLREELLKINEEKNSKGDFLKLFIKSLGLSFIVFFILKLLSFEDRKSVPIFVVVFFLSFFILGIKLKKDRDKLDKEKNLRTIKLQGQVFAKVQELRKLDEKNEDK